MDDNKAPMISVIVPVYNVEKYLPSCINSILAQSFQDFELILIDDGSKDQSGDICDQYKESSDKVIVIHQENKGVSAARNAGLAIARGKYLGFVDADDTIEKEMYQTMVTIAEDGQYDIVACGAKHYDEDGNFLYNSFPLEMECSQKEIYRCFFQKPDPLGGCIWNKLFLRQPIMDVTFPENAKMAEDVLYLFEVYQRINSCKKIPDKLYRYLIRNNSATNSGTYMRYYEDFFNRYTLIRKARYISKELESKAIDKFLDYSFRYTPIISEMAIKGDTSANEALKQTKKLVRSVLIDALLHHKLPIRKIHGYTKELAQF